MAKGRESEMPSLALWEGFFDSDSVLEALGCGTVPGDVIEFGCGYGTFTIAAARRLRVSFTHQTSIPRWFMQRSIVCARPQSPTS